MAVSLALTASSGKIFNRKTRQTKEGQLLEIDYSVSKPRAQARLVAWDAYAQILVVADSSGSLTQFNLKANKFGVIARGCMGATCLQIIPSRPLELAVGMANKTLEIYQVSGRLISTLRGHKSDILGCDYAKGLFLSYTEEDCVLWDSQSWARVRSLYAQAGVFVKASFSAQGNSILTLFSEGILFEWSCTSYELVRKFQTPKPESFACDFNRIYLAGNSSVHIYDTARETLLETVIDLPTRVKKMDCLKPHQVGVLGNNGVFYILDTKNARIKSKIQDKAHWVDYSEASGKVAAVQPKGNVTVYDLNCTPETTHKPRVTKEQPQTFEPQTKYEEPRLSLARIKKLLEEYGEFPYKYRITLWKRLLGTPDNQLAFQKLSEKGTHSCVTNLEHKYPLKDKQLLSKLETVMSCLAHHCPIFSEAEFVPAVVFPFVKLTGELLTAFEFSLSLLVEWMQHWFEKYPEPPINYILAVEECIQKYDSGLWNHLKSLGNCSVWVWPVLQNLFIEVMTQEEWLSLVDHLLAERGKPEFLVFVTAAYFVYFKSTILSIYTPYELNYFLHKQNPVSVKQLIKLAKELHSLKDQVKLPSFEIKVPLTRGEYPLFTNYPEFAIKYQEQVRERIFKETQEIQLKNQYLEKITERLSKLEEDEFRFRREQEALIAAEQDRRKKAQIEEQVRFEEKRKLDNQMREKRLEQIKRIEETVESSLRNQEKLKEIEMRKLEEELSRKQEEDKYYMQNRTEEEALSLVEFKATQRLLELMRARQSEEAVRNLRLAKENWEKELESKDRLQQQQWRIEDEERRLRLEMARETKLKEVQEKAQLNDKLKLEKMQRIQVLERELNKQEIEKERRLRQVAEEEALRNEEALAQIRDKYSYLREYDEKQFQRLLDEEHQRARKLTEERMQILQQEREKQNAEMQRNKAEIEEMKRQFEKEAYYDKIREMRRENELKAVEEEKQFQDMLLKIEEERELQRQYQQELENKERNLEEKLAFQQRLFEEEDKQLQDERTKFYQEIDNFRRESQDIEVARSRAHHMKLDTIQRQREKELEMLWEKSFKAEEESKTPVNEAITEKFSRPRPHTSEVRRSSSEDVSHERLQSKDYSEEVYERPQSKDYSEDSKESQIVSYQESSREYSESEVSCSCSSCASSQCSCNCYSDESLNGDYSD